MDSKPSTILDERPVTTVADVVDTDSDQYKLLKGRLQALLDDRRNSAGHIPDITLMLNGSALDSHVPEDFFVSAHALGVSLSELESAITTAEKHYGPQIQVQRGVQSARSRLVGGAWMKHL